MHESIWSEEIALPQFNKLEKNIKTDVLIIGGGLAGLLCAYFLEKENIDYVLVEGRRIASGVTGNTTAKITSQHGLIYSKIAKDYGLEKAALYLKSNQLAVNYYKKMCKNIDCDFEEKSAYTYTLDNREKIENEIKALNRLNFPAEFSRTYELPFETQGAVKFPGQAQFNPLKFIRHIAKNLNIYENTFIDEIKSHSATANGKKIFANKIVVATHFPFINKHGFYFLKLYQHRSYVSAFENAQKLNGMYVDENKKGMSFRSYKNYLLIGGGGHRTGKIGGNWNEINAFAKKIYPEIVPAFQWSAQDCMSLDGIPYIGMYSGNTADLLVATGFNKWGITSSMVSALLLKDLIFDRKNEFSQLFSPDRSILKPQLAVNIFESSLNLLTPSAKRCSHLGCALKWNKWEHSWDCPCHGSRFDKNGNVLENPAKKKIKP